jgi:predicted NACHT family NTPase
MLDWLAVWGASQAVGFVFKPILEELATDAAKDWVKDFFKDSISKVVQLPSKEPLDKAAGKALKEFLQLVQQELESTDLEEENLKQYIEPLKQFLQDKSVRETLGRAFQPNCITINIQALAAIWNQLNLLTLPDDFNWERIGKLYLKKVKAIVRESDDLRPILDSQNLEATAQNTHEMAGIIPDLDLVKYREGIQEQYGNLKLDSLDTSGCAYNELRLWRMFVPQNVREVERVLPQIHEIPKEHQQRLRESNQLESELSQAELERYKQAFYKQSPQWVFEIWNYEKKSKHIVILGDPGSGKSTLLQYIALEWTELPIKDLSLFPIPILIELRTYIRNRESNCCQNFLEFLHKGSGLTCHLNQHQLHERLKAGNAVVMFDGLDEVFDPGKREDVITDIHRFTNDYAQLKVIVTSRVIGYKPQRLKDAGFRHFMLQDLEQYKIDDFIHRWHELTFNDEAEKIRKRDRLKTAIETSPAIRELAGNPLLLTMMAILNRNQELPRDRPELYNQASRVLLHQWDVERILIEDPRLDPKIIDYKDKQAMLRQVAYYMQANESGLNANLIAAKYLEDILTDYLKTIETSQARDVAKLMSNQLRIRNFILCFMGADYYAFVHRTFLEYFCAWEFVWQFEKEKKLSPEQLKTEVFGQHWHDESWHEVLRLITGMIEPRFIADIIEFLIEQDGENQEFINLFLAASLLSEVRSRSTISEISDRLLNKLQELITSQTSKDICIKAVEVVSNTWKNNSGALVFLQEIAQTKTDNQFYSQEIALRLARISRESKQAFSCLQSLAEFGNETAISELVKITGKTTQTLNILLNLVEANNKTAIIELIKIAGDDPQTLPILKNIIRSSKDNDLKIAAIEALIRYWKQDNETISIIKKNACSGDYFAIKELAKNLQYDPEVLSIIITLAKQGNEVAIEELAYYWEDEPETLSILQKLAKQGNKAAAIELALGWSNDDRTFYILRNFTNSYISQSSYLAFNNNQNDEVQIILKTLAHLENQRNNREIDLEKWLIKLARDGEISQMQDNLKLLKREKKGTMKSHFSTLRTRITDAECLIKALQSLGIEGKTNADVRGFQGQRLRVDVVAVLNGDFDIGWSENEEGTFDVIADLWGVSQKHNQTELINSINQMFKAIILGYKRFVS